MCAFFNIVYDVGTIFTFECYVVSSNPSRATPCILSKRKIYAVKIKAHNILCESITTYVYGVVSRCKDFY